VLETSSDGVRIAYAVEGEGPPLLLVHGLGYDSAGWGPLLPLLSARFTVVRFDNRGTGESGTSRLPFTVRSLAGDAGAVLAAAGIERAHVLGISLGGLVAQELAVSSPRVVGRLVLAGTTPGGPRSFGPPKPLLRLFAQAPTIPRDELLHRLVVNALGPDASPELVGEIFAYRRSTAPGLSPWLAQAAAGAWFGITGRSGAIAAPTLVVHGSADNVVDPRNGRLLADGIPGARFVAFEDAGHLLYWEHPERFASVVGGFLAE
jgi:3-oxoadipate enol-lactonase